MLLGVVYSPGGTGHQRGDRLARSRARCRRRLVAVAAFDSGSDATFQVVLDIAISTTLISYIWIFPAALKLRYTHPEVKRPYHIAGRYGMWVSSLLTTACVVLGSWVAVFPGTLERLVGLSYDFKDNWGVSRGKFEALTLGTLAVISVLAVAGYVAGARVRRNVSRGEGALAEPTPPVPTG
jgi:glutamate:GABA antiporter